MDKYKIVETLEEATRFRSTADASDASAAVNVFGLVAGPRGTLNGTIVRYRDGKGPVVVLHVSGSPHRAGFLAENVAARPSITELFEAVNDHRAACRRALVATAGDTRSVDERVKDATDAFAAKLTAWGVADLFDLSDLYS